MKSAAFALSLLASFTSLLACESKSKTSVSQADTASTTMLALPGAEPYSTELLTELRKAVVAKGPEYVPRTRHLTSEGQAKYTNRLAREPSPYLQQHWPV